MYDHQFKHYWIEIYDLKGDMARRVYRGPIGVERPPRRAKMVVQIISHHPNIERHLEANNTYEARVYSNLNGRTRLREVSFEVVPHKDGVRFKPL